MTNRAYDSVTGWLNTIQTGPSGSVQNLAYTWDLVGNLSTRKDVNQSNLTEAFFYDNLYRLDYSQRNGVQNLDLSYDALGNITHKSDVGNYTYHGTKKHQVTSTSNGWSFGYDNNGNMTSGRGATITWTSYNYPASISNGSDTASFSYTPNRQYWRQISNYTSGGAATTIYVGGLLEKVTSSAGTDFRHMIRAGGSSIIVSRQSSGTNSVHYVTSDHLGSSSAITNSSGGILVNSSFDAFGKRRGSNWSGNPSAGDWTAIAATTRRGYTEHSMLDNLGLIHMNGRVHDPVIGRFISSDPLIDGAFNTQGWNRLTYVKNNPLSRVDPSGFASLPEIPVVGTRLTDGWSTPRFTDYLNGWAVSAPASSEAQLEYDGGDEDLEEIDVSAERVCKMVKKISKDSKADMAPVPFTDDFGNAILNQEGDPMMRPAGVDPHFYTTQGATDRARATAPNSINVNSMLNFRMGGAWDAQRSNGQFYGQFRDFANVAIGLYAGARGWTSESINGLANLYAREAGSRYREPLDERFEYLAARNVDSVTLGQSLQNMGDVCTPASQVGK